MPVLRLLHLSLRLRRRSRGRGRKKLGGLEGIKSSLKNVKCAFSYGEAGKEFKEYLLENGIEVTPGQLRQYRHRDRKFVYIKLGNHVLYPKHINEHLLEQTNGKA